MLLQAWADGGEARAPVASMRRFRYIPAARDAPGPARSAPLDDAG